MLARLRFRFHTSVLFHLGAALEDTACAPINMQALVVGVRHLLGGKERKTLGYSQSERETDVRFAFSVERWSRIVNSKVPQSGFVPGGGCFSVVRELRPHGRWLVERESERAKPKTPLSRTI